MVDLLRFENGDFALLSIKRILPVSKRNRQFRISNRINLFQNFKILCFSFGGYSNIRKTGKMKNFFRNDCTL